MATKGQIIRLAARIEGLAQQSDSRPAVAFVWWDRNETKEQALERHYAERPGDRAARATYVFCWRGRRTEAELEAVPPTRPRRC